MSEATIRTAIFNAVNGVSQVGQVYDHERHTTDYQEFIDWFKTSVAGTPQIRGWMVSYGGIPQVEAGRLKDVGRISRTHRFKILGVMGIDDSKASEKTFAALGEAVCNAIDSDTTVHGFMYTTPAALGFDSAIIAGILVHLAAIDLQVTESV